MLELNFWDCVRKDSWKIDTIGSFIFNSLFCYLMATDSVNGIRSAFFIGLLILCLISYTIPYLCKDILKNLIPIFSSLFLVSFIGSIIFGLVSFIIPRFLLNIRDYSFTTYIFQISNPDIIIGRIILFTVSTIIALIILRIVVCFGNALIKIESHK